MNTTTSYGEPTGQLLNPDDDDLNLDLDELDPETSAASSSRHPSQFSRFSSDLGRRIPLRNLRVGGRRRPRHDDAEELEDLVEADERRSKRRNSGWSGEQDGLLSHGVVRRVSQSLLDITDARDRRKGLWQYIPFRSKEAGLALPVEDAQHVETEDEHDPSATRTIVVGRRQNTRFPANAVSNAKYTPWSFLPRTLWNEFKFFFNMYFLLVALSQVVPALRIGYLSTYIAPLAFVISITLGKEAYDDVYRRKRDNEANSEPYKVLRFDETPTTGPAGPGTKKRKIKAISERKRGKRRRLADVGSQDDAEHDVYATSGGVSEIIRPSRDLKVGDVIVLGKDQRVPADVVILKSFSIESAHTNEDAETGSTGAVSDASTLVDMGENATASNSQLQEEAAQGMPLDDKTTSDDPSGGGEAFIRTDQLDGETDWKLRLASPLAQTLPASEYVRLRVSAGRPDRKVNEFIGTIELLPRQVRQAYDPHVDKSNSRSQSQDAAPSISHTNPLTIDHTAWANTVIASSTIVHALVLYTGPETRAALSTSPSRSKTGLLEHEINALTKILCVLTALLSALLVILQRLESPLTNSKLEWYVAFTRFLILFSTIVPISLRVNLDMGKSVYAWIIHRDAGIPDTIVRTSTIPEDLGRIEYLLSDKTGTLTRNEMELRKVHVGTVSYGGDAMEEVGSIVRQAFTAQAGDESATLWTPSSSSFRAFETATRTRREIGARVRDLVIALALCHNVTPIAEESSDGGGPVTAYQASSPDEIAIVRWTEAVGLRVAHRDRKSITLQSSQDGRTVIKAKILNVFPFTSESKRMGIIVSFLQRDDITTRPDLQTSEQDGDIVFYQKGADTVMSPLVAPNDWLDEETGNLAREGLRTLVVGRKPLSASQYAAFTSAYNAASLSLSSDRDDAIAKAVHEHLEQRLDLLGVTGVEDKLQPGVKPSLELLRNAGIKIWMLTGDKVETARCIAISSKLVRRGQRIHTIAGLKSKRSNSTAVALEALSAMQQGGGVEDAALLIDGQSLTLYLSNPQLRTAFITLAVRLPAVIACRCSPTQKADLALLIRAHTGKRIACIGDGGNDVSMIQAADIGVGIVGKEGRQASLAADFSITQFAHLTKLLLWHGRNSYRRSAKLAQFVMHRGLIISVCQSVFSFASAFEPVALYRDWLLVGYATVYTMAPVFSLVLDRDVDEGLAKLYPELYAELKTGRSLSYRSFFIWVAISIYQGIVIQGGAEVLVPGYRSAITRSGSAASSSSPDELFAPLETPGFKRMVAVSYTALIMNEILMVAIEITTWHPVMIFSILGTALFYFGSLPFLDGYYDLKFLLQAGFWWRFVAVTAASLIPVYAGKVIRRTVRPPSYRKVRGV